MRRPQVRPLLGPGLAEAVRPRLRLSPPNLQKLGEHERAAALPRSRLRSSSQAKVPPPSGHPALLLALPDNRTVRPLMRLNLERMGVWASRQARRGRLGRPSCGDVRLLSRWVALETAFPSLRVSGDRPLPFSLFLNGGKEAVEDQSLLLSSPQFLP